MSKIRKRILIIGLIIAAVCLAVWIVWDNKRIVVTAFEINSGRLPEAFDGYRIVHVSDLHNDEFGEKNEKLLAKIKEQKPDMIAITGDLLDSRRTDIEKALNFAKGAAQIAPCYYVTGNHESRMPKEYRELEKGMVEAGVIVLRNKTTIIEKADEQITLIGIDDPRFVIATDKVEKMERILGETLTELQKDTPEEDFTLLLSHRPELFDLYCAQDLDVVLSGHVHGGQFRLPFIGGIIGPGQGILPDYDAGLYTEGNTNMILSRGLGQSIVPFRINNPPELVVITLYRR